MPPRAIRAVLVVIVLGVVLWLVLITVTLAVLHAASGH